MIDCHVFLGLGAGPVTAGGRSGAAASGVPASAGPSWWLWHGCPSAWATTGAGAAERRRIAITMARSSGKGFFANFSTYDAPFPAKVRLALANS